jgi:glycosyl-4,4'-diaponeurosporenoate acyltransferase
VLVELPILWTALLNVLVWLVIQLGLAWAMTQIPAKHFNPRSAWARLWNWEKSGRAYEKSFAIKRWKDWLPDAAGWFKGGFPKAELRACTPDFLERFLRETWRGELTHWLALLALPVFAIWNPVGGIVVNIAYALAANLPCILVQRYNRARFLRILEHTPKTR